MSAVYVVVESTVVPPSKVRVPAFVSMLKSSTVAAPPWSLTIFLTTVRLAFCRAFVYQQSTVAPPRGPIVIDAVLVVISVVALVPFPSTTAHSRF